MGVPRIGICTPSICSPEGIEEVLGVIIEKLLKSVNISEPILVATIGPNTHLLQDNSKFTGGAIAAL